MQQTNYEVRVGLFSLIALILLVWGWAWLKSFSLFHPPQRFVAQFDDVSGLSNNATVNVQGVRIGTVEDITFTKQKKIDVHIKISAEEMVIPKGADISIQTLGLVGAKYIEITLPRNPDGSLSNAQALGPNDIIYPIGEAPNETLASNGVVHNPVRTELIINNVAKKIGDIVDSIDTDSASSALNNLSQATAKLNKNMDRLGTVADSVKSASASIANTSARFGKTADSANNASEHADTFFKDGDVAVRKISSLATELTGTSGHLNRMLNNPNFSSDLKETITQARQTAETVRGAMSDLNNTLKDQPTRDQIMAGLTRIQQATENIKTSMEIVNKVSTDQGLRSDLKDTIKQAREAMSQANTVLANPLFTQDLHNTLTNVSSAACNVEKTSKQIQQILSKRAPLLKLLFGRPGKLPPGTQSCPVPSPSAPVPGRP